MQIKLTIPLLILTLFSFTSKAEEPTAPKAVLNKIDQYINKGIDIKAYPGAQLMIGNKNGILYSHNYGKFTYDNSHNVDNNDLYDLASCTKIMASTLAVMRLVSENKLSLDNTLGTLVPHYSTSQVSNLTLKSLLTHTTGMKAFIGVSNMLEEPVDSTIKLFTYKKDDAHPYLVDANTYAARNICYRKEYITQTPDSATKQISANLFIKPCFNAVLDSAVVNNYNPLRSGRYRYSDLNFYFIQKIIEEKTGLSLDKYVATIYDELNIQNMGYNPLEWKPKSYIAPTEWDGMFRRDTIQGYVHDEFAAALGGISGNAGLFSNASSMGVICQMFLNKGLYNDKQILKPEVVEQFTKSQIPGTSAYRGLGFDKQNPAGSPYSGASYGHTGFTGTYFWIDPELDIYVILLTNRVYPTRTNRTLNADFRKELWVMAKEYNTIAATN